MQLPIIKSSDCVSTGNVPLTSSSVWLSKLYLLVDRLVDCTMHKVSLLHNRMSLLNEASLLHDKVGG